MNRLPITVLTEACRRAFLLWSRHPENLKPLLNIVTSRISVMGSSGFPVAIIRGAFSVASFSAGIFRRR
jgi:hypothetical protein